MLPGTRRVPHAAEPRDGRWRGDGGARAFGSSNHSGTGVDGEVPVAAVRRGLHNRVEGGRRRRAHAQLVQRAPKGHADLVPALPLGEVAPEQALMPIK